MKAFLALLFAALMLGISPAHAMLDRSGIEMGTIQCPTQEEINCDNPMMDSNKIIAVSNQCIGYIGINESIMSDFHQSGEFEGCVTASRPSKTSSGFNNWAVCCVKPDNNNKCGVFCTRYIDQKK